jgi:hypothetical protein
VWIELCSEEDGSFPENLNTGRAERSRQRYESMREQSIVGGGSTGQRGVYGSNQTDPKKVKQEVAAFRQNFQNVHYCFESAKKAYEYIKLR